MDLTKAPDDQELKNIIDKLAQFVARNGIEFEQMTKNKQKDNPKFGFLFGGEHYHYYQYKVSTEQTNHHQQQRQAQVVQHVITQQSIHSAPWQQTQLHQQHQEQIQQSERNLAAQHHVLMQQQQLQIDEEIHKAQEVRLQSLANECGVDLMIADKVMQPIVESCTKDSISAGKSWIFKHSSSPAAIQVIGLYLVKRITAMGATFEMKLHIVYLLNDVLHHCTRKNAEDLKRMLEAYVVPIFCTTCIGASDEQQQKLAKLLRLWETNKYFDPNTIEQLKSPATSLAAYQANLIAENANVVTPITISFQSRYASLQKQHQDFVAHLTAQLPPMLLALDNQKSQTPGLPVNLSQTTLPQQLPLVPQTLAQPTSAGSTQDAVLGTNAHVVSSVDLLSLGGQSTANVAPSISFAPTNPPPNFIQNFSQPPPGFIQSHQAPLFPPQYNQPPPNFNQPPPTSGIPPHFTPDLSKPPPGFPPIIPPGTAPGIAPTTPLAAVSAEMDQVIMPNVPYFELPAGLMTTLVKLEDCDYCSLDPKDLCLPPPQAPSERLLTAVELFYGPPSHDRPRNSDGWEQLGLYEFFKAKSQAKKKKDEDIREGLRPRSHSRSRSKERFRSVSRSPPRRRYREEVTPKPTVRAQRRSKSKSRSKSRSRSRSPPPPQLPPRKSRSRSRSKSPVSPSQSSRIRRKSASRSPTPPSFFGGNYATASMDRRLDESNKGHQLLKKMGWGGAGLGSDEQGMQEPISGGEVRDRQDQYKGVGISLNDPFENFRKSKGQAFINRMKARAEEKLGN